MVKPRRRAPAKSKRTTKRRSRSPKTPAQLARVGDLDALFALADCQASSSNDRAAYKWLNAARDFGHRRANAVIGDVLEVTSMRYDDGAYETAAAHWELACAYLEGTDGLPRDLRLAKKHLGLAFEHHRDLDAINAGIGGSFAIEPLRERLRSGATTDALRVLDRALSGEADYASAIRYLKEIPRLVELQVPEVILGDHRRPDPCVGGGRLSEGAS